ncbi:MAG TPA: hypothetical protein VGG89_04590 [Candidatus Baltobacteraceae bacterium]
MESEIVMEMLRTLTLGVTAGTLFGALLATLPIKLGSRLILGAVIGGWITIVVALAGAGVVNKEPFALPVLFALPLLAASIGATIPAFRSAVLAIPMPLIVALNGMRVLGVFMLLDGIACRMNGPFPYAAGIGDIITGVFALPVARLAAKNPRDVRVWEWNVFGAIDLVVAVTLGVMSSNGSPIQFIHAGVGSSAMTTLPWALIPLVLVPAYLIGHAIVFAQLRSAAPDYVRYVNYAENQY